MKKIGPMMLPCSDMVRAMPVTMMRHTIQNSVSPMADNGPISAVLMASIVSSVVLPVTA